MHDFFIGSHMVILYYYCIIIIIKFLNNWSVHAKIIDGMEHHATVDLLC